MAHDVEILATPRRTEALQLTAAIRAELAEVARQFYEIGLKLRRIIDEKLYLMLGYPSFRDYVAGELSVAATQAFKMIRVVRAFTASDASRLGLDRAALLITYARAVGSDDAGALVRQDATIGERPVTVASRDELSAAIRAVRDAHRARQAQSPRAREAAREGKAIAKRLHALTREQGLGRAKVEVRDDEVVVRFARGSLRRWIES